MISIDDFAKCEFRVGTVLEAEEIDGSEKLLKLKVDFGPKKVAEESDQSAESADEEDEKRDIRQILSGIKQWYQPEDLMGKQFVFITNLEPRMMMGLESQGMILAAEGENKPIPIIPQSEVAAGSKLR